MSVALESPTSTVARFASSSTLRFNASSILRLTSVAIGPSFAPEVIRNTNDISHRPNGFFRPIALIAPLNVSLERQPTALDGDLHEFRRIGKLIVKSLDGIAHDLGGSGRLSPTGNRKSSSMAFSDQSK